MHWPNNVNGEAAKEQFYGKGVDYYDSISVLIYYQHFNIHGMKDPDYTTMMITTYSTLDIRVNEIKWRVNGDTVCLKYPDIVRNHYTYQHDDYNHNNLQRSFISIENTWATSYWHDCVFAFLHGVKEVNIFLALTKIYGHEPMRTIEFRNEPVKALLNYT